MKNYNTFDLDTRFDARQSFYGKAKVIIDGDKTILRSYDTAVAIIDSDGKLKVRGKYSQTTTRHTKEFARQYGFNVTKGIEQYIVDYDPLFENYDA